LLNSAAQAALGAVRAALCTIVAALNTVRAALGTVCAVGAAVCTVRAALGTGTLAAVRLGECGVNWLTHRAAANFGKLRAAGWSTCTSTCTCTSTSTRLYRVVGGPDCSAGHYQ